MRIYYQSLPFLQFHNPKANEAAEQVRCTRDSMADIIADDPLQTSVMPDPVEATSFKEDAATTATRRELKQTSISDKGGHDGSSAGAKDGGMGGKSVAVDHAEAAAPAPAHNEVSGAASTPPAGPDDFLGTDSGSDDSKRPVSSPKKKRAHDQVEENKDGDNVEEMEGVKAASGSAAVSSRTDRLEPEKKRARDLQEGQVVDAKGVRLGSSVPKRTCQVADTPQSQPSLQPNSNTSDLSASVATTETAASDKKDDDTEGRMPQTSSSAFSQSPFAKLATSTTSGFGSFGGTGKPSVYDGTALSTSSPFTSLSALKPTATAPAAPAKLSFGGAASTGSPFSSAGLNGTAKPSGFGSVLGGSGFAGSLGPRLTSFASHTRPADSAKNEKSAKPFGAPDSDAEDNEEDRDEDGEDENTEATEEDQDKVKEDVRLGAEDTKKPKLQKSKLTLSFLFVPPPLSLLTPLLVVVDDGESGEATVLAVRAKMYQLENKEVGWKERGAGMLKLNIPKSAIEFDASGTADITSFDPSGLEDNDEAEPKKSKSVRLLMRQDHTLRLLLNTTVVPAVKFQLIPKLKAAHVLFTAFEANEVKQVQMKVCPLCLHLAPGMISDVAAATR